MFSWNINTDPHTNSPAHRCASTLIIFRRSIERSKMCFPFLPILRPWWVSRGEIENEGWDKWKSDKSKCFIQEFWMYRGHLVLSATAKKKNSRGCHSNTRQGHFSARRACSAMCTLGSRRLQLWNYIGCASALSSGFCWTGPQLVVVQCVCSQPPVTWPTRCHEK